MIGETVMRVAVVMAFAGSALLPQTREIGPRPTGTAALGGRILRDTTPVARVVVAIDAGDGRGIRQTVTDDDGKFLFEGLPAGRFLVTASKAGWVTSYFGSPRPGRPPGVRVVVDAGARVNVQVPIVPGSVIAGRIVAEDGRPMARQWPWLLEYRMVGDRRMLARATMPYDVGNFERSTDDRGEFRLFGLPPGTYFLVVNPSIASGARITTAAEVRWALQPPGDSSAAAPAQGPVAGYASMYFPGTPDPGAAQPIVVGPAEVRDDLMFRVSFVSMARVAGIARREDGRPAASVTIALAAREAQVSLEGSGRQARTDAAGRFTFQNVPPGDYRLSTRAASAVTSPPVLDLWGQTDVVVSGSDTDGVTVTLAPASAIEGRLVFNKTTLAPPDPASIQLHFLSVEALAAAMSGAGTGGSSLQTATVQADGSFRAIGLAPGRYVAEATWPGMRTGDGMAGWWLTSTSVGARDLGDAPIDVRPNEDVREVTITFRDRIGAIEGVLTDPAGRPAPEYVVLAFPVERSSWTSTSRRVAAPARPGTDGRFRLPGLVAGAYYLAVVTAVGPDEATDPAFLEAIVPSAMRVSVAEGETRRQDLRIGGSR